MGLGSDGIMIGNVLGSGQLVRTKTYVGRLCVISILIGILSGLVILTLTPLVLSVANLSDTTTQYLKWMLVICSCYMIGKSVNITTIAGVFCAGGDSKFGFICDTVVIWCIIVPIGVISAFTWKLPVIVVYFILNLDKFLKLPAVYINYKKYKWIKDLTNKEAA